MALILRATCCPTCGAPLSVEPDQRLVICAYCNSSLGVERTELAQETPRLAPSTVSKQDIERVKQLLLDGKRDEAISHYAQVASVPGAEAARAVESVYVSEYWKLTRHVPINGVGFALYFVLVGLGAVPAVWAAMRGSASIGSWLVIALGSLFALYQLFRFGQHLRATWVTWFGSLGRGRVLQRAVVREEPARGAAIMIVSFEVAPDDGSAPFVDEETLFVRAASVAKLETGNVVRVRFDRGRTLVFPTSPITVP